MITEIIGRNGSGKTALLLKIAEKSKVPILSNFVLDFEYYKPLTLIDILNLPNNHKIFLDEGYTWLESRTSSSQLNRYMSRLSFQKRKRGIDIYITTPLYSTIDKRFREFTDYLIIAHTRLSDYSDFEYTLIDKRKQEVGQFGFSYESMSKIFNKYDTYQVIEPYNISKMEFSLIEQDSNLLLQRVNEISDIIINDFNDLKDITHDTIKAVLINHKIYIGFSKYVYIYLKNKLKTWNYDFNKAKQVYKSSKT